MEAERMERVLVVDADTAEYYRDAPISESQARAPLERDLRAIGAWLDERIANHVSVLQVPDGYFVRYQLDGERLSTQLSADMVAAYHEGLRRNTVARHPGIHQDLFRAVAHELDMVRAGGVLLEEVEEEWLLTYQNGDPATGLHWRKNSVLLTKEIQKALLDGARARRESLSPSARAWALAAVTVLGLLGVVLLYAYTILLVGQMAGNQDLYKSIGFGGRDPGIVVDAIMWAAGWTSLVIGTLLLRRTLRS